MEDDMPDVPLGERVHMALIAAAKAKSEAQRAERLAKRVFSQLVISGDGAVSQREHAARAHINYISAEDAWITAQTEANLAGAEADALQLRFAEWQSINATTRVEMGLR
jgi:hypothetical protein